MRHARAYHNYLTNVAHNFTRLGFQTIVHAHIGLDRSTIDTLKEARQHTQQKHYFRV